MLAKDQTRAVQGREKCGSISGLVAPGSGNSNELALIASTCLSIFSDMTCRKKYLTPRASEKRQGVRTMGKKKMGKQRKTDPFYCIKRNILRTPHWDHLIHCRPSVALGVDASDPRRIVWTLEKASLTRRWTQEKQHVVLAGF